MTERSNNFEQISHIFVVCPLLTSNKWMPAGYSMEKKKQFLGAYRTFLNIYDRAFLQKSR